MNKGTGVWIKVQGVDKGTWCEHENRMWIRVHGVDMGTWCGYGYMV